MISLCCPEFASEDSAESEDILQRKIQFVEENQRNAQAWSDLGISMGENSRVIIDYVDYQRLECLQRAVELDPDNASFLNNLGCAIPAGTDNVDGCGYTQEDCYRRTNE